MRRPLEISKTPQAPRSPTSGTNPVDFRFSLDFFQRIPDAPGIFWMQDSRRQILFVGAAERLRTHLMLFKSIKWHEAHTDLKELCQKVKHIDWNSTPTLAQAQDMKKAMIRQCHPLFNKKTKGVATPLSIEIQGLTPQRIQLHWGEFKSPPLNKDFQTFGPFYGRNALHRTFSALLRWIWIVGNTQPPESIPPYLLKPLLRNSLEVPIDQLFFENQRWIHSLDRFLNGFSDLFLDYGLRRIENMVETNHCKVQKELFAEDLVFLDRFFKRYCNVKFKVPSSAPQ